MPKNIDGRDFITRFVIKVNGETQERMAYGFEGCAELLVWYFNLAEQYGNANVDFISNQKYLPMGAMGLAYQAAMAIMGCVDGVKKAFGEIETKVIDPETAKLNLMVKEYQKKPTQEEVITQLAKLGVGSDHTIYKAVKEVLEGGSNAIAK